MSLYDQYLKEKSSLSKKKDAGGLYQQYLEEKKGRTRKLPTFDKVGEFLNVAAKEIVRPFARVAVTAGREIQSMAAGGAQEKIIQPVMLPWLGETTTVGKTGTPTAQAKDIAGNILSMYSVLRGGRGVAKTAKAPGIKEFIKTGAKEGAISTAAFEAGEALSADKTPAEIAKDTVVGAIVGTGAGAVLGPVVGLIGKAIKGRLKRTEIPDVDPTPDITPPPPPDGTPPPRTIIRGEVPPIEPGTVRASTVIEQLKNTRATLSQGGAIMKELFENNPTGQFTAQEITLAFQKHLPGDMEGVMGREIRAPRIAEVIPEVNIAKPVQVADGPAGNMMNIGMEVNGVERWTEKEVVSILKNEFGISAKSVRFTLKTVDGEANLSITYDTPQTDLQMFNISKRFIQDAIPQYSNGVGKLHGPGNYKPEWGGGYNHEYFKDIDLLKGEGAVPVRPIVTEIPSPVLAGKPVLQVEQRPITPEAPPKEVPPGEVPPPTKEVPPVKTPEQETQRAFESVSRTSAEKFNPQTVENSYRAFKEKLTTNVADAEDLAFGRTSDPQIPQTWALSWMENYADDIGDIVLAQRLSEADAFSLAGQRLFGASLRQDDTLASVIREVRLDKIRRLGKDKIAKEEAGVVTKLKKNIAEEFVNEIKCK